MSAITYMWCIAHGAYNTLTKVPGNPANLKGVVAMGYDTLQVVSFLVTLSTWDTTMRRNQVRMRLNYTCRCISGMSITSLYVYLQSSTARSVAYHFYRILVGSFQAILLVFQATQAIYILVCTSEHPTWLAVRPPTLFGDRIRRDPPEYQEGGFSLWSECKIVSV